MRRFFFFLLLAGLPATVSRAATAPPDSTAERGEAEKSLRERFSLEGYGTVNYFSYDWDTDPNRRRAIDLERLVLYPVYRFTDRIRLLGEVEVEHGGTGVTKELDRFDESGEFETEVEQGGEVTLEQLNLSFRIRPYVNVRAGRVKLPFGLAAVNDEPNEYLTTTRSETEASLIPTNWYENGVQLYGRFGPGGRLAYTASLVNGLDAAGFNSRQWIAPGHQTRFEQVNAENLAVAGRLDVALGAESFAGVSAYYGNSADNRPKPDLPVDAYVSVFDAHLSLERGPLRLRGLVLYGEVQNAALVSDANRSLPRALGVESTPVGSAALGYTAEAAYDVLSFFLDGAEQRLDVFGRYEFYDSMYETAGETFNNPRWERTAYTGGVNARVIEEIVLKAQYSHRTLGLSEGNVENTFSMGFGFEF